MNLCPDDLSVLPTVIRVFFKHSVLVCWTNFSSSSLQWLNGPSRVERTVSADTSLWSYSPKFPPRSDVLVVDLTVLAVEMNCKVSFISPLADIHLFPWKLQSHVSWCPSVKWLHRQGSLFVTTSFLRRDALIQSKDAIYRKLLYPLPVECLSLNDLKIIVNRRKKKQWLLQVSWQKTSW